MLTRGGTAACSTHQVGHDGDWAERATCLPLRLPCARLAPMHALATSRWSLARLLPPRKSQLSGVEIVSTVALLRQATVRVVEAVVAWRGGLTSQAPFAAPLDNSGNRSSWWWWWWKRHLDAELPATHGDRSRRHYELSAEMPGVLHEAPSRLDRRRLWRARRAIDLEPQTTQRAIRQMLSSNAESSSGGVRTADATVAAGADERAQKGGRRREVDGCLFEIAAESDEVLIAELEASGNGMLAGARVGGVELPAS